MVIFYILGSSFFAYIAGATAQGMRNGWKKDLITLFLLIVSWYISVAMIGHVLKG